MMRLFKFDNLITPGLIRMFFFAVVALECLFACGTLITVVSMPSYMMGGAEKFLVIVGIFVGMLVAIVLSRMLAEVILVTFMIRDELAWPRLNRAAPDATTAITRPLT